MKRLCACQCDVFIDVANNKVGKFYASGHGPVGAAIAPRWGEPPIKEDFLKDVLTDEERRDLDDWGSSSTGGIADALKYFGLEDREEYDGQLDLPGIDLDWDEDEEATPVMPFSIRNVDDRRGESENRSRCQDAMTLTKPIVRLDCLPGGRGYMRPCPFNECRYHLDAETDSCALDVADRGPQEQATISELMGLSIDTVQRLEQEALNTLHAFIGYEPEEDEEE